MKANRVKRIVLSTILILVMLAATACGTKNPEPSNDDVSTNSSNTTDQKDVEKKQVRVVYKESEMWEKWFKELEAGYEADNPDIDIVLSPIMSSDGDFFAKLSLMLMSDDTVDVITEDTFKVNSDIAAGYLADLDVDNWDDWGNFYDKVKSGVTGVEGKVYGVPISTDTRGIWYNKEIFEKVGLGADWQPETWEDILVAARTVKEKAPEVTPLWLYSGVASGESTTMQGMEMFLYGTEDSLYEDGKWVVKSQGFLDSLNFFDTVFKEELGPDLADVLTSNAWKIALCEMIPKGELAMVVDGHWISGCWIPGGPGEWADYADVMGFAKMPKQNGGGYTTMSGGWALSVNEGSLQQEEAFDFIKYATNKDNLMTYTKITNDLTPRQDISESSEYQEDSIYKTLGTQYVEYTNYRPANEEYPSISAEIQTAIEAVVSGELTPEEAMDSYAKNITKVVGDDKVVEK